MSKTNRLNYAVAYCRYSSELQREESIEAQLRAIEEYAQRNGYIVVEKYIDRAKSATTDQRPEFQRMIRDSAEQKFNIAIVHKLDRFSRDRFDSAFYKRELKRNGVKLYSVSENLDDSPESIILESVLEGMAEYYSRNLAREVEKGRKENAMKCLHVGGIPPLGYDVDKDKKYVINEYEAEAVKLIFRWVLEGKSYDDIIAELNRRGYKSKRGQMFGKNALYSILKNEKYIGNYIYNRLSSKDTDGKRNNHKLKSRDKWIIIEGGVPSIISKKEFEAVQEIMSNRMQTRKHSHAKESYLLTGKIVCGICGGSYVGSRRIAGNKSGSIFAAYGCNRRYRTGKNGCENKELSKSYIENYVIERISEYVFSDKFIPKITQEYNQYIRSKNHTYNAHHDTLTHRIASLDKDIDRTVSLLLQTTSNALTVRLQELESERARVQFTLDELLCNNRQKEFTEADIKTVFAKIRDLLTDGTLETVKTVIDNFVSQIVINPDNVVVQFNFFPSFTIKPNESIEKDRPLVERVSDVQGQSIPHKNFDDNGGDGGS